MKLLIEEWIDSQKLSPEARELLLESVKCYKATAYRAAYIMSYLGFQREVRFRILSARRPSSINEQLWDQIISKLRNDDTWDSTVYDEIRRKNPGETFRLSGDLRHQVEYWKNRRNDCAHAKDNEVGFSHVESFWLFLRSNLAKFVVDGSKQGLLNRIQIHFNRGLSPAGQDPTCLTTLIPYAVEPVAMKDFFSELDEKISAKSYALDPDVIRFYDTIFDTDHDDTLSALKGYLNTNNKLARSIFRERPDRIQFFAKHPKYIRNLWHNFLFKGNGIDDMVIYCALLRNDLIPESELVEAHETVMKRGATPPNDVDNGDQLLDDTGFYKTLYRLAFEEGKLSDFEFGNGNAELIIHYLGIREFDDTIARVLSSTFSGRHYPYTLNSTLNRFFRENEKKRQECKNVMTDHRISFPKHLNLDTETTSVDVTE